MQKGIFPKREFAVYVNVRRCFDTLLSKLIIQSITSLLFVCMQISEKNNKESQTKSYPFYGTLIATNPSQKDLAVVIRNFISTSNVYGNEFMNDYCGLLTNIIN